jgi:Tol biopolymer transport system component
MAMRVVLVGLVFVVLGVVVSPAAATFPGRNGLLAFYAYVLNEESTDIDFEDDFIGLARIPGGPRQIFARGTGPAFAPNGDRLAYAGTDPGPGRGIWLTRADCRWPKNRPFPQPCSRLRRLTRGYDFSPAWLPNGKRVAFVRGYDDERIYSVRADGGGLRFLVRGTAPDWSSKGALAFVARGKLRVREPGGRVRTLPVRGGQPSWAPGGDRLAFIALDEDSKRADPGSERKALFTIRADGTGLKKLWAGTREDQDSPYGGFSSPTWSPDGRWIAFIKDDGLIIYTESVFAIRPSGGPPRLVMRPITNCLPCSYAPQWGSLSWQARRP